MRNYSVDSHNDVSTSHCEGYFPLLSPLWTPVMVNDVHARSRGGLGAGAPKICVLPPPKNLANTILAAVILWYAHCHTQQIFFCPKINSLVPPPKKNNVADYVPDDVGYGCRLEGKVDSELGRGRSVWTGWWSGVDGWTADI